MRRIWFAIFALILGLAIASPALAQCTKIQSGTLTDIKGNPITVGFDKYGYNYQAHMFNGLYENYSRPDVVAASGDENLVMKWSDDWLANVDCNRDQKLDRGLDPKTGNPSGVSKGWVTNHFEGDYATADGELHHYTYFVKIVWVGDAPQGEQDPWEGKRIWGPYAIIEEVNNDPDGGFHGVTKDKLVHPGLGLDR